MLKWVWLVIAALIVLCGASVPIGSPENEPAAQAQEPGKQLEDLSAQVEDLVRNECHWRLPNSHASLVSGEARGLQSDLRRGQILAGTVALAGRADEKSVELFKRMLSQSVESHDTEFRAIVLCRLLATCGVPRPQILKHVPGKLLYEEFIAAVIEEGIALRELL